MIKFSAPGYIEHDVVIMYFIHIMKEHPEYFIENRILDSAYGMPGYMIWNGGRSKFNLKIEANDIYDLVDEYKKLNFKLRHTCTNYFLSPELFGDFTCNQWLDYCQQEGHGIITFSEDFAQYIRKQFPKYNIIWSTTRRDDNIELINNLTKQDLLVLDYKYNHDDNILKQLQNPHNIEILCGENCISDCPHRTQHYFEISKIQMRYPPQENENFIECPYGREYPLNFYQETLTLSHAINNDDVDYLYNIYGIENFKISGRNHPDYLIIEMLCYYLIKPEYQNLVRQEALRRCY